MSEEIKKEQDEEIKPEVYEVKEHIEKVADTHDWKQNGPFLECISCDQPHGSRLSTDLILMGFDNNNQPILKKPELS